MELSKISNELISTKVNSERTAPMWWVRHQGYQVSEMSELKCLICRLACPDGLRLTNGQGFHRSCYNNLSVEMNQLQGQVQEGQNEVHRLNKKIAWHSSFWGKLAGSLLGRNIDIENLKKELLLRQNSVALASAQIDGLLSVRRRLYDYWPDYPPDWHERTKELREEYQKCSKCNSFTESLHVHHKIPISEGGNHLADNLSVLCRRCHSQEHGNIDFSSSLIILDDLDRAFRRKSSANARTDDISIYARRIRLIRDAITSRQIVHFEYTKRDGSQSIRSVKAEEIIEIGDSLCLRGYCYLRQAQRTFAIKRMRNTKLRKKPGICRDK